MPSVAGSSSADAVDVMMENRSAKQRKERIMVGVSDLLERHRRGKALMGLIVYESDHR